MSTSAPMSSIIDPLAEYHAKLSQHLNALLSSSSPRPSSSTGSSPTVRRKTTRAQGSSRRTGSFEGQRNIHGSLGESSTLPRVSTTSSSAGSSHSLVSGDRSKRKSSRQAQPPTSSRGQDLSSADLTARPDHNSPALRYATNDDDEEAPALVHHQNNTSSSQSGPTEAIASPPEVLSPTSPVERFLSRESPRGAHTPPTQDHLDLGTVAGSAEHVDSREEEHRRAWKADGARVWKTIPEGFTLNLDKRSRKSSDESKDEVGDKEGMINRLKSDTTPRPKNTSPADPPSPFSAVKSQSQHSSTSGKLHRDSFKITNDPDLASKMGLVSTPPVPSNMSPPKFTFGKFNQHIQPVPRGKADVLAGINGRLGLSVEVPRGQKSPRNPSVQPVQKPPLGTPGTSGTPGGGASTRTGASGPTILGPSFSIPRPKDKVEPNPRSLAQPQVSGSAAKKLKMEELRDAFAEEDKDEEYEARREIRMQRRQVDLRKKIGKWASTVFVVDSSVPEIDPTPPSPSVATAIMRASPLVASPLVPASDPPHTERSKLSISIIPDTQSISSRSTTSSQRKSKSKSKSKEHLRHASAEKPREPPGLAPKPTFKSIMFTYSTSIDDSSRRMRAIDALLGDMSLKGSNLNPSRTNADTIGSTSYTGVLDRVGVDGETTPRRGSKSKEAPSSLNPKDHSHLVLSLEDGGERAREIEKMTEFSTAFDLTIGAGSGRQKDGWKSGEMGCLRQKQREWG